MENGMKKIALLLTSEPQCGGEHQYAMQIAECLRGNIDEKYELVAICTNRFWKKWCKENKVRFDSVELPMLSNRNMEFCVKHPIISKLIVSVFTPLGKWIIQNKIDILFCTQQGICLPNLPVKVVRPVHDLMHRYEVRFDEIKSTYNSRETLFRCVAKFSSIILVDSKLGRKQFHDCYGKIENRQLKVEVLPFIVPQHVLNDEEEYIETPSKYIFYPAQFWQHKNHINLLKAINLLKNTIPDIHVVLCGSEKNCLRCIKRYISESELEKNVTILGFVSDKKIAYLYRHATALVMPTYFGPTNIPPLEAMTLGCPVAVSNKYAMPEQVGNAGLTFNPDSPEEIADCILKLWTDERLRQILIERGYKRVKKWGKNEFDQRILKILELLM
jgi:glycosyltransferase involved in cell wall biosynthesis